ERGFTRGRVRCSPRIALRLSRSVFGVVTTRLTEVVADVALREHAQPVTANLHRQQFPLLPRELINTCHCSGHNNTVTLRRVEHVDEFCMLVPERHIVGGGAEVFPCAVIVLT